MILIKLDTPGSAIFYQTRIGKEGRSFELIKLRTMIANSQAQGYQTQKHDPRLTKIGKVLRFFSLDELPQLINIIKGEMSFVGPRPDVLEQKALYSELEFAIRHSIRPGLTGLAQSRVRHQATLRQRIKYDLFYVRKRSFLFDLKILLWTLMAISKGDHY